jgi:hypothetical protein
MKGGDVAVQASELVALWQQERGEGRHPFRYRFSSHL